MKRNYAIFAGIAATLSLAVAAAVQAHPGGGMGMGPMMGGMGMGTQGQGMGPMMGGMGPQGMAGRMGAVNPAAMAESHLAVLKVELKITASQEGVWQAFAVKATQQAETMQAMRSTALQASGTAPERLEQRATMMKQQIGNIEAMTAAVKDLYAVLSPEQKAIADQRFGMMNGGRMAFAGPGR